MQIKLILTDLDGTLVDTKKANFLAYQEVLKELGYRLTAEKYDDIFGLRFDEFMHEIGITNREKIVKIKERKKQVYPSYFRYIKLNNSLFHFIENYKKTGCQIGLISTAQKHNIHNVLSYFNIEHIFNIVVSGDEIVKAKPDPSAYVFAMQQIGCTPTETLIFEDSKTGTEAAQNAGASFIIINDAFFKH